MKPLVIVQARSGSSRFPRKVLADIHGRPMLAHVIERAKQIRHTSSVMLATSTLITDDPVAAVGASCGVWVWRGSEIDVLDRFYQCALASAAESVARITGDCPLLDPDISSGIVEAYLAGGYEYVSNVGRGTDGWDTECFSFRWLRRAWVHARGGADREHVTTWIRAHLSLGLALTKIERTIPGGAKWSVDTEEDLERVRAVVHETETRMEGAIA